jgi:hypothetical protein
MSWFSVLMSELVSHKLPRSCSRTQQLSQRLKQSESTSVWPGRNLKIYRLAQHNYTLQDVRTLYETSLPVSARHFEIWFLSPLFQFWSLYLEVLLSMNSSYHVVDMLRKPYMVFQDAFLFALLLTFLLRIRAWLSD